MTANERFAMLVDALGLTQTDISRRFKLSQGYISQIMNGKRRVTGQILQSIANEHPESNIGWVLTGIGEMFFTPAQMVREVNENQAVYEKGRIDPEPFELLRQWKESFEARIKHLEAEMERVKARLPKEYKDNGGGE